MNDDIRSLALRGGLAKVCAQAANFALRVSALMVLARLLRPEDFGLVAMVTAVTGVLNVFKDFGLSTATIQRSEVTDAQMSTLFWVNVGVGSVLTGTTFLAAPIIAELYREPRLVGVTAILAFAFVFNAAGVQPSALLQRQMRFATLAIIETAALVASIATGVIMALLGWGYWSLVGMTLVSPAVSSLAFWAASDWRPRLPRTKTGIKPMLRFGSTLTLNGVVVYVAYNFDKFLLGRYWGPDALGLYSRAYQLINIPTDNLNAAVGGLAFSALARIKEDPTLFKAYFLKGYALVLSMTLPVTLVCMLFADEIIVLILGSQWQDSTAIFRLLAPTIMIYALINPLGWLLLSLGLVGRSLKVALVLSPLVVLGYLIGLPYGPVGVAVGYSTVMALWVVPHVAWCVHGTGVSLRDVWSAAWPPFASGVVACGISAVVKLTTGHQSPGVAFTSALTAFTAVYCVMLMYVMGQWPLYVGLLRGFRWPWQAT